MKYADPQNNSEPYLAFNYFCQEVVNDTLFINLLETMQTHILEIKSLTPLPTDSTTQEREKLLKLDISEREIQVKIERLQREIDLIGILLIWITKKIGARYLYF